MKNLLSDLRQDFPQFSFTEGKTFVWSPKDQSITYVPALLNQPSAAWTLLHELAHGVLGHTTYDSDLELVQLEAQAWQKAKQLSKNYKIKIDEDYVQDCLDTYRDWLHLRSTCPNCDSVSLQTDERHYRCFNCTQEWSVTANRFCRPYRRMINKKTTPAHKGQALFI